LFGTLKVQSFMLTKVKDCDLLIGHETRSALDTDTQTCREENIHAQQKLIETGKQRKSVRLIRADI